MFLIRYYLLLLILLILRFDYITWPLREHDVIKVCSIEYFTTEIELVLPMPTFKFWYVWF